MTKPSPIVGILCNIRQHETGIGHTVNTPYLQAIQRYTSACPILIPNLLPDQGPQDLLPALSLMDGLLLTGGRSNIDPHHYGVERTPAHEPYEHTRDLTSFALIEYALANDLPLLGICRGMQELNVHLGGSLIAAAHEGANCLDHRMPEIDCFDARHAARHEITLSHEGRLREILQSPTAQVNSLHRQAVDALGAGLHVEARAPDGIIEALSVPNHPFVIGVQWHPEHQTGENHVSEPLFRAFDRAMQERRQCRC